MSNVKRKRKLVWFDMETGGLNGRLDDGRFGSDVYSILEVCAFVSDQDLDIELASVPLFRVEIHVTEDQIQQMDPWAQKQHEKSGLLDACRQSALSLEEVEDALIEFLKDQGVTAFDRENPTDNGMLAGNSIGFDRDFIRRQMPKLDKFLHYQMLDLSGFKYAFPSLVPPEKAHKHTAFSDICESFRELQNYREQLVIGPVCYACGGTCGCCGD